MERSFRPIFGNQIADMIEHDGEPSDTSYSPMESRICKFEEMNAENATSMNMTPISNGDSIGDATSASGSSSDPGVNQLADANESTVGSNPTFRFESPLVTDASGSDLSMYMSPISNDDSIDETTSALLVNSSDIVEQGEVLFCSSNRLVNANISTATEFVDVGETTNLPTMGTNEVDKNVTTSSSEHLSDATESNVDIDGNELAHENGRQSIHLYDGDKVDAPDKISTVFNNAAMATDVADVGEGPRPSSEDNLDIPCQSRDVNANNGKVNPSIQTAGSKDPEGTDATALISNMFKRKPFVHLKLMKSVGPIMPTKEKRPTRQTKPVNRWNFGDLQCAVCKKKFRVDISPIQLDDGRNVCSSKCLRNE